LYNLNPFSNPKKKKKKKKKNDENKSQTDRSWGVLEDKINSSPLLQRDSQQARDLHISC
jgi:hypothetical protein